MAASRESIAQIVVQKRLDPSIKDVICKVVDTYYWGLKTMGLKEDTKVFETVCAILNRVNEQSIQDLIRLARWAIEEGETYYLLKSLNPKVADAVLENLKKNLLAKIKVWSESSGFTADDDLENLDCFADAWTEYFNATSKLMRDNKSVLYLEATSRCLELTSAIKSVNLA